MNGISQNIAFLCGNKLVYASCQVLNQEMIKDLVAKTLENDNDQERIKKILTDIIDKYVTENHKN